MINLATAPINKITKREIDLLVNQKVEENQFLEYKVDFSMGANKLAKEVVAFANSKGGIIIIGVEESKDKEGGETGFPSQANGYIPKPRNVKSSITNQIKSHVFPLPSFSVKVINLKDKKKIVVIKVEEGYDTPYATTEGKIYQRIDSDSDPVKDAYALNKIIDKRQIYVGEIESFSENPVEGSFYESGVLVELYFYVKQNGFLFNNFDTKKFTQDLFENFNSNVFWILNNTSGHIKFHSLESSKSSYILRALNEIETDMVDLSKAGTYIEVFRNDFCKMLIPISETNINNVQSLRSYVTGNKFIKLVSDYKFDNLPVSIIDGYESSVIISILVSQYLKLLRANSFTGEINYRIRLNNSKNRMIFIDDPEYIDFIGKYKPVVNLKNKIEIPDFRNGNLLPLVYTNDDQNNIAGIRIASYILESLGTSYNLFTESPFRGFIEYVIRRYS